MKRRTAAWLVGMALLAGCGDDGGEADAGAPTTEEGAASSTTTTSEAAAPEAQASDPAADPNGIGEEMRVEVESKVDPRVEIVEPCELLDADAATEVLGEVGDHVELEDGAACGLEADSGDRVALGIVRSDGIPFLTDEEASRGVALDDPNGAVWVTGAPVEESDLLVIEVGSYADLVVEVSAKDRPETERRALAPAVARAAIERFAEVEAP